MRFVLVEVKKEYECFSIFNIDYFNHTFIIYTYVISRPQIPYRYWAIHCFLNAHYIEEYIKISDP